VSLPSSSEFTNTASTLSIVPNQSLSHSQFLSTHRLLANQREELRPRILLRIPRGPGLRLLWDNSRTLGHVGESCMMTRVRQPYISSGEKVRGIHVTPFLENVEWNLGAREGSSPLWLWRRLSSFSPHKRTAIPTTSCLASICYKPRVV
jgi:hypothetical protein